MMKLELFIASGLSVLGAFSSGAIAEAVGCVISCCGDLSWTLSPMFLWTKLTHLFICSVAASP